MKRGWLDGDERELQLLIGAEFENTGEFSLQSIPLTPHAE
jgi:hypothetical protein